MEANTVKCSACSKLVTPKYIHNPEDPLKYFECTYCKDKNFAIQCPSCSELTISSKPTDLCPGKKIRCRNANCVAVFQYISCPMLNCRKLNYFTGDLVIGNVLSCGACKTSFQDLPCSNCGAENYFRGTSDDYYHSGMSHSCRKCHNTFLHITCPHCKELINPPPDYRAGEKIRCGSCQKSFQQTNCPSCKKPKYYLQCELKVGTKETCACSKAYKTCLCPHCTMVNSTLVEPGPEQTLQEIVPKTCNTCRERYQHILCPRCIVPFYVPLELRLGKTSFQCFSCNCQSIHLFNCQVCRKRYFNKEREILVCPNGCVVQEEPALQLSKAMNKVHLEEEKDTEPPLSEDKMCKICMESERNTAFLDCGHFLCCWNCSNKIMATTRKCPICKKYIAKCQRIYIV